MKKIVVYYSYEGNTKFYAETLAGHLGAELLSLKPVKEKTSKGFSKYVWGGYQAVMRKKPTLLPYDFKVSDYDTIIFATPVWAGTYAPPLRSFFENEDIVGKKITFLYTHQGGPGKVREHLKEVLCDNHLLEPIDLVTLNVSRDDNKLKLLNWADAL